MSKFILLNDIFKKEDTINLNTTLVNNVNINKTHDNAHCIVKSPVSLISGYEAFGNKCLFSNVSRGPFFNLGVEIDGSKNFQIASLKFYKMKIYPILLKISEIFKDQRLIIFS